MSTPENPLAQYHTYSYHHILIAAPTTDVLDRLSENAEFSTFIRPAGYINTSDNPYGKYAPLPGGYSIVINGMTDANLVITKLKYETVAFGSPGNTSVDAGASPLNGGFMVIEEPRGVRFFNDLQYLGGYFNRDPGDLFYMIKTIFIGYPTEGLTFTTPGGAEYDPITNVRPIFMSIQGIKGDFGVHGAKYAIDFTGDVNGSALQSVYTPSMSQITVNTNQPPKGASGASSNTVVSALQQVEDYLNEQYSESADEFNAALLSKDAKFEGKRVRFLIRAEEPYGTQGGGKGQGHANTTNMLPNGNYTVTDFKVQNTDTGEPNTGGIITLSTFNSVPSAITNIVYRSIQAKEEAVNGVDSGGVKKRYTPSIHTSIQAIGDEVVVTYKLRRIQLPDNTVISKEVARRAIQLGVDPSTLAGDPSLYTQNRGSEEGVLLDNALLLNYIYTGKSDDIINFDMKMDMFTFFMALKSAESLPTHQGSQQGGGVAQSTATGGTDPGTRFASGKTKQGGTLTQPVHSSSTFPPPRKFDYGMTKHVINPRLSGDYQVLLNDHLFGSLNSQKDVRVTIHGNPGILNAVNIPPSEVASAVSAMDTGADINQAFPYWSSTPALCYIHVLMPVDTDSFDSFEPFWYQSFFQIMGIVHSFDNSVFTQELIMYPTYRAGPLLGSEPKTDQTAVAQGRQAASSSTTSGTSVTNATGGTSGVGTGSTPSSAPQNITIQSKVESNFTAVRTPGVSPELQATLNNLPPDQIPSALQQLRATVGVTSADIENGLRNVLQPTIDATKAVSGFSNSVDSLVSIGGKIISGDIVRTLGHNFPDISFPSLSGNLGGVFGDFASEINSATTGISGAIGGANVVGNLVSGIDNSIASVTSAISGIQNSTSNILSAPNQVSSLMETSSGLDSLAQLSGVPSQLSSLVSSGVVGGIGNLTSAVSRGVVDISGNNQLVSGIGNLTHAAGRGTINVASSDTTGRVGGISTSISQGISQVGGIPQSTGALVGGIGNLTQSVGKGVINVTSGDVAANVGNLAGAVGSGVVSASTNALSSLGGEVLDLGSGAVGSAISSSTQTADALVSSATNVSSSVASVASSLTQSISSLTSLPSLGSVLQGVDLGRVTSGLGASITGGIGGALSGAVSGVTNQITGQVQAAISSVSIPGINVGNLIADNIASLEDLDDIVQQPNFNDLQKKAKEALDADISAGFKPSLIVRQEEAEKLLSPEEETLTHAQLVDQLLAEERATLAALDPANNPVVVLPDGTVI